MTFRGSFSSRLFLAGALLAFTAPPSTAYAQQNLTWDVNGAVSGTGGTGAWNETSAFWRNGGLLQTWNNSAFDNAIFAGTAGTVTVAATPINVHNMTFDVGGYTVTGGTINFGGVTPVVTTNVGVTTINSGFASGLGFAKNGAATLALGGNRNNYTGVTTVNAGTLRVDSANALGASTAAANLVLNGGTTFLFNSSLAHNYTLTGGTVNVQGNAFTWAGAPTLTAATTLNLNGTTTSSTLSGNLADTGASALSLTQSGTGRATLSGNNSYTGATTVTRGRLQLGGSGALSAGSNLVFNGSVGTGGAIGLTTASGNFIRNLGVGAGQVQWLGDGGFLSAGSNRTVNLGGAGATLSWGTGGFVPAGNQLILGTDSNNRLDFQNPIDLSGGIRAVRGDGGTISGHARMTGILSGTGGLNQVGNGFLELTGANTYTGGTVVTSGILVVGSDANLGDASGALSFAGGTLLYTAAMATGRSITLNASAGAFRTDAPLVVSGPITGVGQLTKTGAAMMTLTGAASHSGGTVISAGTLQIGNGGTIGRITGDVVNNSQLVFDRSDASTFAGQIAGTGTLTQRGTGTTILSGDNSYTGGTTVGIGTLQIGDGGVTGSILGDVLVVNGGIAFARSDAITFGGRISGGGGVAQRGAGTLTLSGGNSYGGGTIITTGTLSVASNGNLGNGAGPLFIDNGTLRNTAAFATDRAILITAGGGTFSTGADLLANGTITGGGALIKQGAAMLTLTRDNEYTGGTVIDAGTLQIGNGGATGRILGNVIDNGVLAFNRSDALDFGGTISGAGHIEQRGEGILTLTGNSTAFAGETFVIDGTLAVNGVLGGTLEILAGARLEGTGTVGSTTIASGGTLAPGSPDGRLSVAGDMVFDPGSIYEVKSNPAGLVTLAQATGAITIGGGTVNVVTVPGNFRNGARYTILTAGGGRSGQFAGLTETLLLFDMTLAYNGNSVFLDVARNSTTLCSLAVTANQCAASSIEPSVGSSNPVVAAVLSLPDVPAIQNALDLLSGEIYASAKGVLLDNSRYLREAVTERARYAPGSAGQARGSAVWSHAFGSFGDQDGGNAAALDTSIGGVFVGADAEVADLFQLGFATGYSNFSLNADERASSASSDDYHLALYGGARVGPLGLRLGAAQSWHDIQAKRSIEFSGFSDAERADYGARTAQIFGEAGLELAVDGLTLEPFAQVARVGLHTDSFDERGGQAALTVFEDTELATFATYGLHAAISFAIADDWNATARGTLGWRQVFGDAIPHSLHGLGSSSTFLIAGAPIAEDALVIDAGLDVMLGEKASVSLAYNGQIARFANDNGVRAHFNWRF